MIDRDAICVWCGRTLHPAPTTLGWAQHADHRKGICFECIERLDHARRQIVETEQECTSFADFAAKYLPQTVEDALLLKDEEHPEWNTAIRLHANAHGQ